MPRVYQSEVKAWPQKAPLHSPQVRPRSPQPAPPEPDPHPPAAEAAPAQYQADTDDPADDMPLIDVADMHQNDTVEAPHNKADSAPADTPRNEADADAASGPLLATHLPVMMY